MQFPTCTDLFTGSVRSPLWICSILFNTSSGMRQYTLHFDGACKVNPGGPAGWGWILRETTADCRQVKPVSDCGVICLPDVTNNIAEWTGLSEGLQYAANNLARCDLEVYGDSRMVIEQVTCNWRVRKRHLLPYAERCWGLLDRLSDGAVVVKFEWVPREENGEADLLSKSVIELGRHAASKIRRPARILQSS